MECQCLWWEHIHITYEYKTSRSINNSSAATLDDIEQRLSDLRREADQIQDTYRQLAEFYQANALIPGNDSFAEYLQYFIDEEMKKQGGTARNNEVIASLQELLENFRQHMEMLRRTIEEQRNSGNENRSRLEPRDIFALVNNLYTLPINGRQIREQVQGIEMGERQNILVQEQLIQLPEHAASSTMMVAAIQILTG